MLLCYSSTESMGAGCLLLLFRKLDPDDDEKIGHFHFYFDRIPILHAVTHLFPKILNLFLSGLIHEP